MQRKRSTTCESQNYERFSKGDTILLISTDGDTVGVILEGKAHVLTTDNEGRSTIVEFLEKEDGFGAPLLAPIAGQEYTVIADSDCSVMFISYSNGLYNCRSNCKNHADLIKKLLLLTSSKVQSLSQHIGVLSQRTLRGKILAYLESRRDHMREDGTIRIPMTLVKLADYLGVDRSAMMREIHNMNADGLICSKGRDFQLLQ